MRPTKQDHDVDYHAVFDQFVDTKVFLPDSGAPATDHTVHITRPREGPSTLNRFRASDTSPMPSWDVADQGDDDPWRRALQYLEQKPSVPQESSNRETSSHPYSSTRASVSDTEILGLRSTLLIEQPLSPIYSPPLSPIPLPPAFRHTRVASTVRNPVLRRKPSGVLKPVRKASAPSMIMRPTASHPTHSEAWAKRIEAAAEAFDVPANDPETPPPSAVFDDDEMRTHSYAFGSQYSQDLAATPSSATFSRHARSGLPSFSSPIEEDAYSIEPPQSPFRHWSSESLNSVYETADSHSASAWDKDLPTSSLDYNPSNSSDDRYDAPYNDQSQHASPTAYNPQQLTQHPVTLESSAMAYSQNGVMIELPPGTAVTFASPAGTTHSPAPSATPTQLYFASPSSAGASLPSSTHSRSHRDYGSLHDRRSASPSPLPRSLRRVGRFSSSPHRSSTGTPQPQLYSPHMRSASALPPSVTSSPQQHAAPHTPRSRRRSSSRHTTHSPASPSTSSSGSGPGNINALAAAANAAAFASNASLASLTPPGLSHAASVSTLSSASSCGSLYTSSAYADSASGTPTPTSTPPLGSHHGAGESGRGYSGGGLAGSAPGAGSIGFVHYTPHDRTKILTGVAPSGSSKTKARREREAAERRKRLESAAARAIVEAGGDLAALEREGFVLEGSG